MKMKRINKGMLIGLSLLLTSGCYDQMYLEDASITLMLGIDLDPDKHMVFYSQSPVFYKEAKKNTENSKVTASSLRESRIKFDAELTGLTIGSKVQTVLVSKRLLEQDAGWIKSLDLLYRDPKQQGTSRLVMVDGKMEDLFSMQPPDKPRLALHVRKLVDTVRERNHGVNTNVSEFRRQMADKGITPSIIELRKTDNRVKVTGTSLLSEKGKYVTSLSLRETALLLLLQDKFKGDMSLTVPVHRAEQESKPDHSAVNIALSAYKRKVKVGYAENKFQFQIHLRMKVNVVSVDFPFNSKSEAKWLQDELTKELQLSLAALIKNCQEHELDPFGYGLLARAYQYQAWKPVQDEWGKAFADAQVTVTPQITIQGLGGIE
ncbi:Ger(x)C family spore germination protein [Paenibacillus aestuarii]|uniref:Ger(X)C family spore germination protein n=1 Tax=Paenibacillus aestuarii TaxID=516965 RepID=A0ABW0KES4_9BACL|nr:Ger(x)C family spore germination protein [Paenibacillus aestuarii]